MHNARLIAAAPELLGALIALYAVAEVGRDEDYGAVTKAAAVIAKALYVPDLERIVRLQRTGEQR